MFCTSCGIKNAADSNFCKQCGGKLDRAAAAKINADAFERAMPEDEQVSTLLERAYRLRKENNPEGAIALCQEILHLRDDSTSAHSFLGQLYEQQGDREAAIREYERVLLLNPGSIADRVKLDELRGQTEQGSERKAPARVVMADPHVVPGLGYARFTSAGIAVALLVLGGLVVLQFRPRTDVPASNVSDTSIVWPTATGTNTAVNPPSGSTQNSGAASTTPIIPRDKTAVASTAQLGTLPGPAVPNSAGVGANTANTLAANNSIPPGMNATNPAPPTIIYRNGPVRYVPAPTPPASNVASATRLPGVKPSKTNGTGGNSGGSVTNIDSSGHVMLTGDPDVTESNDKITVQVRPGDVSGKKKEGTGEGNGFSRIEVDKTPSGTARTVPAPGAATTTESRSFLAVGDEKKRQHKYRDAIDAFTKSLASAGDQTGYVLQQRASCYQQLNELSSARADYEHAISEYRKMEARDPETARNGVRTCERGVKLCGN